MILRPCKKCKGIPILEQVLFEDESITADMWTVTCFSCYSAVTIQECAEWAMEDWNSQNAPVKRNLPLL